MSYFTFLFILLLFQIHVYQISKISLSTQIIFFQSIHQLGLDCLKNSGSPYQPPTARYIPFDDQTIKFRKNISNFFKTLKYKYTYTTHCFAYHCGPWLEYLWKINFIDKPILSFGPFIPLFIRWKEMSFCLPSRRLKRLNFIFDLLPPNTLFFTVSEDDKGIGGPKHHPNLSLPKNLVILSSGGQGHIPIPNLKQTLSSVPMYHSKMKLLFMGTIWKDEEHGDIRSFSINWLNKTVKSEFVLEKNRKWLEYFKQSDMIVSLRGQGRGCYRTYEILQLGMIPFIIHDGIQWTPYLNSNVNWEKFSIIVGEDDLKNYRLPNYNEEDLKKMRKIVLRFRNSHFTDAGLMDQIQRFLLTGYYDSDLRCDKYNNQTYLKYNATQSKKKDIKPKFKIHWKK